MRVVRGIGAFVYDFLVGDDPKLAVLVLVVLVSGGVAVAMGGSATVICAVLPVVLALGFTLSLLYDVRTGRRSPPS